MTLLPERDAIRDTRVPEEAGSAGGPREYRSPQRPSRFMIGKYEVFAQPIPGSMHMLRYTVSVAGKRIGATASVPTESDCRYMEKPPPVPPLKPFQAAYRPGRPKKNATPQAPAVSETRQGIPPEDVPIGLSLRQLGVG